MEGFKGFGLGFSYGGRHSSEFGITRTSVSDRYSRDLPQSKEITQEISGSDGLLYFGSTYQQKTFTVPFAFEEMNEFQWRDFSGWIGTNQIQDLIFDEEPYKIWSAKITGKIETKYLAFSAPEQTSANEVVYRGQGTLTFTCYYPFARSYYNTKEEYPTSLALYPLNMHSSSLAEVIYDKDLFTNEVFVSNDEQGMYNIFGADQVESSEIVIAENEDHLAEFQEGTYTLEDSDISLAFRDMFPEAGLIGWKDGSQDGKSSQFYCINNVGDLPILPTITRNRQSGEKLQYSIIVNSKTVMNVDENKFSDARIGDHWTRYEIDCRTGIVKVWNEVFDVYPEPGNIIIAQGDVFELPLGVSEIIFQNSDGNACGAETGINIEYNYLYLV